MPTLSQIVVGMLTMFVIVSAPTAAQHGNHGPGHESALRGAGGLEIPESIRIEHSELHEDLAAAIKLGGRTGRYAQALAERMHEHFQKEEEIPMPLLGMLVPLAHGNPTADAARARALSDKLRAMMPTMLEEHDGIRNALADLKSAATAEGHTEVVRFSERLAVHAQNEEEVLYPAALLIGELLRR